MPSFLFIFQWTIQLRMISKTCHWFITRMSKSSVESEKFTLSKSGTTIQQVRPVDSRPNFRVATTLFAGFKCYTAAWQQATTFGRSKIWFSQTTCANIYKEMISQDIFTPRQVIGSLVSNDGLDFNLNSQSIYNILLGFSQSFPLERSQTRYLHIDCFSSWAWRKNPCLYPASYFQSHLDFWLNVLVNSHICKGYCTRHF